MVESIPPGAYSTILAIVGCLGDACSSNPSRNVPLDMHLEWECQYREEVPLRPLPPLLGETVPDNNQAWDGAKLLNTVQKQYVWRTVEL